MRYPILRRDEIKHVIQGRGNASRVPVLLNFWLNPQAFAENEDRVRRIIQEYPDDLNLIPLRIPDVYQAPDDDPAYRWSYMDKPCLLYTSRCV